MTWALGLAALAPTAKRQAEAHRTERPGVDPVTGDNGRDRLAAEIQDLLPANREDRLALHKVLDFLAQPQGMDVAVGRVVAAGA
jgi:hypothetical protein